VTDLKASRRERASSDRLPPHSIEAEQAMLGCIFLAPKEQLPEAVTLFKSSISDCCYDLRNQTILDALVAMYDAGKHIDVITVQQHLRDNQLLDQVGGFAYLAGLPEKAPSVFALTHYAGIVKEKWKLRKMIATCTNVVGRVYESEGDVDALIADCERDIAAVMNSDGRREATTKELVLESIAQIERASENKDKLTGLSTGLIDFDKLTCGLQNGDMVVIAARPSVGKTSLAMGIAEHNAVERGVATGVFSLEMSGISLTTRTLCSLARVDSQKIRRGELSGMDFTKLTNAATKLAKSPLYIDDTAGITLTQLRAKARRWHQLHGIKLLVVDYLQLMHDKAKTRQEEVSQISNGLKALAKELNIPVLVLCQLNRDLEKGGKAARQPRLSDIRESGAIEQDADVVGLLFRKDDENEYSVTLDVAKQRNGPTGEVELTFLKQCTRFEAAAKAGDE
jgi:replicative DNA helicase